MAFVARACGFLTVDGSICVILCKGEFVIIITIDIGCSAHRKVVHTLQFDTLVSSDVDDGTSIRAFAVLVAKPLVPFDN